MEHSRQRKQLAPNHEDGEIGDMYREKQMSFFEEKQD